MRIGYWVLGIEDCKFVMLSPSAMRVDAAGVCGLLNGIEASLRKRVKRRVRRERRGKTEESNRSSPPRPLRSLRFKKKQRQEY